ncbi:restriction endonuclease subunit M, partial [Escherichia coli]|nr:restriction endonuclease subunit M [Escherichia coli]
MSNIIISDPEVVTWNTDVICSTRIRLVVTVR